MPSKTLRYFISFSIAMMTGIAAFSQTLINAAGNTLQNNEVSIEYAIGEISIATLTTDQLSVTQGLLQPVVHFNDCNLLRFIPNAFTPNSDNLNDCFGIKSRSIVSSFELCIYNRWGELVFKTNNIQECWNGELHGRPQPIGTYVYIVKGITASCGAMVYKGTVTLIR